MPRKSGFILEDYSSGSTKFQNFDGGYRIFL